MTLPNTFLLGAPKAGTTALSRWLESHPDVHVSVPKEPYYWASDYPRMRRHYGFDDRRDYEALYERDIARRACRRVDGSTTYLYSATAVPDILEAVPDARFIVSLRQPADLLVSYHRTQLIALNEQERDFAVAWRRSLTGRGPTTDPLDAKLVDYPQVGALGAAVDRLIARVPRERVHFVVFDDLVQSSELVWEQLVRFLDLDPCPPPAFVAHNASDKTFRSPVLRRLTHRPPPFLETPITRLRQWSRTTSLPSVAAAKRRMWRSEARPMMSAEVRAEVSQYFQDDVHALGRLISRDLAAWLPKAVDATR